MSDLITITLAAGKGTRMKSSLPKVLHQVAGKSMIQHVVDRTKELNPINNIVIVGYKAGQVKDSTKGDVKFIKQEKQLGTGHAVMQAEKELVDFNGTILVLYGDTPLLTTETLEQLIRHHQDQKAAATILTTRLTDPTGYGRIVRNKQGEVIKIVEDKDTTPQESSINEINTGICCFDSQLLVQALNSLDNNNAQGEYYLTDVTGILAEQGELVTAMVTDNQQEIIGVNTRQHLAKAERTLRERICTKHMAQGVTIIDPKNTYIDSQVEIGKDSIIYPFTFIEGKTEIANEVIIGPRCKIVNSMIETEVEVESSTVIDAEIGAKTKIGPYAYLRPGSKISSEAKIGDFVEIKKSEIGKGSKVPHLSYIGDATIGQNTNIGAGTIVANYDGEEKHRTIIGDNAFIGSDSTLVAPIRIGDEATTGAGSVVTKDVNSKGIVVGVPAKEINKDKK